MKIIASILFVAVLALGGVVIYQNILAPAPVAPIEEPQEVPEEVVVEEVVEEEPHIQREFQISDLNRDDIEIFLTHFIRNLSTIIQEDGFSQKLFTPSESNDWLDRVSFLTERLKVESVYIISINPIEILQEEALVEITYSIFGERIETHPYPVYEVLKLERIEGDWHINGDDQALMAYSELISTFQEEYPAEWEYYLEEIEHFEEDCPSIYKEFKAMENILPKRVSDMEPVEEVDAEEETEE